MTDRIGEGRIVLELAILGLLMERPMHGYQLSRELKEGLWRVSFGSLYPTLRRLERRGAVASATEGTGRRKTVYRITPEGERLFLRLLEEPTRDTQSEDTRFRVRLAFFRYVPPETRVRLLERRRAALRERLDQTAPGLASTRERGDTYKLALLEHGRSVIEADIAWLDELIQAESERQGATPAVAGEPRRRASATLRRKERTA